MKRERVLIVGLACALIVAGAQAQDSSRLDSGTIPQPQIFAGVCPVIDGTLGSGSPNWPGTSGTMNDRLNRDGVSSMCGASKVCDIFTTGAFPYDAYEIPNTTGATACVGIELEVIPVEQECNIGVNAYLDVFDDANICVGYLGDPGLSTGIPPSLVTMSENVPDGGTLILTVYGLDTTMTGCTYELRLTGDCIPVELEKFEIE